MDKYYGRKIAIGSGNKTKDALWKRNESSVGPWIPTIHARPARSSAPVVHPMMSVSNFLIGKLRRWSMELLESYVNQEDIPLIQSLAV